jgi:hypothetical protein
MAPSRKLSVDASKQDRERDTSTYARGGKGAPNTMLPEVPAEAAPSGRTGPARAKAPGAISARGGPPIRGFSLSLPAVGGHCAPLRKDR